MKLGQITACEFFLFLLKGDLQLEEVDEKLFLFKTVDFIGIGLVMFGVVPNFLDLFDLVFGVGDFGDDAVDLILGNVEVFDEHVIGLLVDD